MAKKYLDLRGFLTNTQAHRKYCLPMTQSSLKNQKGEYQPNTFDFLVQSPPVTYPDGIAQYKKIGHEYLTLGHL
jgi:hypothetical protein